MKIVGLTVENVKRISAVEIRPSPDGHTIVVGGRNGAGKTSVLDSIAAALGGKRLCPRVPIRRGQDHAEVRVELDDLVVIRRWKAGGESSLTVTTKDGAVHRSPQKLLDDLVGRLSFDPLEFSRQDDQAQLRVVQELVGLDFTKLDGQRTRVYEERRVVNRDGKAAKARLDKLPWHENAPKDELSVADLVAELERRREHNRRNVSRRAELDEQLLHVEKTRRHIEELRLLLAEAVAKLDRSETALRGLSDAVAKLEDLDEDEIRTQIENAEDQNRRVRQNLDHLAAAQQVQDLRARSAALTERLHEIDAAKRRTIADADYPIDGLSVDETGVLWDGLPLSQASSAELLRVSVAMGLALNPALRVLLIRDGSLLDGDSLELVAQMAADADAQVWIERVGDGDATVVIEDGMVRDG